MTSRVSKNLCSRYFICCRSFKPFINCRWGGFDVEA